jgi:hypothetical protein
MEPSKLEEIADEIQALHKSMKNLIEIVFAISPLLVVSTHGWTWYGTNRNYLLRVSSRFLKKKIINRHPDLCRSG